MALRWAWLAGGAAGAVLLLAFLDLGRPRASLPVQLGVWDTDPAAWGRRYPREYDSWRQAGEAPPRRPWREPRALFAGEALASEVEPAVGPPGHPVSCQVCHDPGTMALRPSRPDFLEALRARRIDPAAQPGVWVCAQCHGARLADRGGGRVTFPLSSSGILAAAEAPGRADWAHALSGVPLVELGSTEHELWRAGEHARRGVSCVDCHMPSQPEGSVRVTCHAMQSPLLDVNASCAGCHPGGERELRAKAAAIQGTTLALQRRVGEALLAAHQALGAARRAGTSEQELAPARALLRQAQTRWAFIASERSEGFHAPQEADTQLGIALDQARQTQLLARRLGVRPGGAASGRP